MAETRWKFITFLFGLICVTNGRVLNSFGSGENDGSVIQSNNQIDTDSRQKDQNSYKQERLSLADFSTYSLQQPNGPDTYAFGYDNVVDPSGNEQFRSEEKLRNGTIIGEYGYTDYKSKKIVRVTYVADGKGYRSPYAAMVEIN